MSLRPTIKHIYKNFIFDSSRWSHYEPRDSDIIVCTSYKAGTTWTQMICALLIHQDPKLPAPLGVLSRWLDMRTNAIDEVISDFDAQPYRRFIKTHTPFDGLPYYENVSYVFCGREPRDVFISTINHFNNMDMNVFAEQFNNIGEEFTPPPPLPDDINERFKIWMTEAAFDWEQDGMPFWSHFRHAQTFWEFRHLPNFHFLHYADLKSDLEAQMRRLARELNIEVTEDKWPAIVKAATFDDMKSNADMTAPDADQGLWIKNSQFFNRGCNEQWRGILSDANLRMYEEKTKERYAPDLLSWLESGSLKAGYPTNRT